jgi:hypothetical protein
MTREKLQEARASVARSVAALALIADALLTPEVRETLIAEERESPTLPVCQFWGPPDYIRCATTGLASEAREIAKATREDLSDEAKGVRLAARALFRRVDRSVIAGIKANNEAKRARRRQAKSERQAAR